MELTIIYGSNSGNCENLANEAKSYFKKNQITVHVLDMADVNVGKLQSFNNLLVITSTWGDGEPPDNAEYLHSELQKIKTLDLSNLRYAVFAVGQSFYEKFCQTGKDFDNWLEKFGAKKVLPIQLSDDDYDEIFEPWLEKIKKLL